jgi:hypothetical protein
MYGSSDVSDSETTGVISIQDATKAIATSSSTSCIEYTADDLLNMTKLPLQSTLRQMLAWLTQNDQSLQSRLNVFRQSSCLGQLIHHFLVDIHTALTVRQDLEKVIPDSQATSTVYCISYLSMHCTGAGDCVCKTVAAYSCCRLSHYHGFVSQ